MALTLVVCYFSAGMSGFAGVSNNLGQLYVFASLSIVSCLYACGSCMSLLHFLYLDAVCIFV